MKPKQLKHGGAREGAGRKEGFRMNKSQLKEKTKVIRVPQGAVKAVKSLINEHKSKTKSRNRLSGSNTSMDKLPSQFQPGDAVGLQRLLEQLASAKAEVSKVSFLPGKVRYDLQVSTPDGSMRLANIDSSFVDVPISDERSYRERIIDELINGVDPVNSMAPIVYLQRNRSKQVD